MVILGGNAWGSLMVGSLAWISSGPLSLLGFSYGAILGQWSYLVVLHGMIIRWIDFTDSNMICIFHITFGANNLVVLGSYTGDKFKVGSHAWISRDSLSILGIGTGAGHTWWYCVGWSQRRVIHVEFV